MTLLIRNVHVVGGKDDLPDKVDVLVSGKKISAIGNFPQKHADEIIDGRGAYLFPGFIDVDTTSDHYLTLFHDPRQEDFLRQGVTSIIGGHCGASLAPLLYGTLESIRKWSDIGTVNVDWHSVREFFAVFERQPLGVNFGTFAGHSTIRRALIGESLRDLTENELAVFGEVLDRSLKEGAFGLSAGLEYVHARITPRKELKMLLEHVARKKGIFSLHVRETEKGLFEATKEALSLARESDIELLLTHFMPLKEAGEEYDMALDVLQALFRESNTHFCVYPFEESIMPIYRLLPKWAQNGPFEIMAAYINDDVIWERIAKEISPCDPDRLKVLRAQGANSLAGYTLRNVMDFYEVNDSRKALRFLMKATSMRTILEYKNIDDARLRKAIMHPKSIIASHAMSMGGGFYKDMFYGDREKPTRSTATFTEFLKMVLRENIMPISEAIEKITKIPAQKLGLERRGSVQEGYFADLAVVSLEGDVQCVVINGTIAMRQGVVMNEKSGVSLKKQSN